MDGGWRHGKIILLSHTLTMSGSDEASLVDSPSGLGVDSVMDRWMDAQKNNVAFAHPYHEGKWCSKFG